MRKLLLGVAVAGVGFATSSQATPMLAYQILDGSTVIGSGSSSSGSISLLGMDGTFSMVSGAASAYPALSSPNFSTNSFSLASSGIANYATLTVRITETGLAGFIGNVVNTFTLNSLTAPSFTSGTLSNYFDASNLAFGTGTLLSTRTFNGSDSFSAQSTVPANVSNTFSETSIYTLNFAPSTNSNALSSSAQLTAVPEPAALALLTLPVGLLGFVTLRRRKYSALA